MGVSRRSIRWSEDNAERLLFGAWGALVLLAILLGSYALGIASLFVMLLLALYET